MKLRSIQVWLHTFEVNWWDLRLSLQCCVCKGCSLDVCMVPDIRSIFEYLVPKSSSMLAYGTDREYLTRVYKRS